MPTLLQINSTANWGSTGKIAEQIGERAMQHGWQSYIAYGRGCNPSKSQLLKIGSKVGQAWHLIISRLFDRHGLGSRLATKRLIKRIEQIKPDIIHLHNIHGYYINYKILFEYLNSIDTPVVWTLHDCWTFTGHCAHFVEANCDRWKEECFNCPLRKSYPKSLFDRANKNHTLKRSIFADKKQLTIVPASNWLANFAKQSLFKEKSIRVIHNGVNINTFTPLPSTNHHNYNIIGVSSIWNKSKGLEDFYKLRNMLDEDSFKITLVGLTKAQINTLPQGITGIERTNSADELAELYCGATVFVNPTYADTFPTTNLEALACGIPVITYRTGGSPEAVCEATGFVVEQGDIDALKDAINEICTRGKAHYSAACRKYAEEHFDKEKCFEKYIELYNELLTNK